MLHDDVGRNDDGHLFGVNEVLMDLEDDRVPENDI